MAPVTIGFAVLMVLLGVGSYIATDSKSWTALIPAIFGVVFLLMGLLGLKDHLRKHAMHAAAALGLISFLAAVIVLIVRGSTASQTAVIEMSLMAVLSAIFEGLCVRSFI